MSAFIDYLYDIGIVVNKSSFSANNLLFALSDYFRTLTPSDSFDLAIRLYDNWNNKKKKQKHILFQKLQKLFKNHLRSAFEQITIAKSKPRFSADRTLYQSPIKFRSPHISSESSTLLCQGLNETCERLYLEGMAQKVKKDQLAQEKVEKELKDCTFKPQITCDSSKSMSSVFDRLYRTQLIGKADYQDMKDQLEMYACTFTPQVQKGVSNMQPKEGIFDRLYKESEQRVLLKESLLPLKEQKEIQGCTFKPEISARAKSISKREPKSELYARLHNESAEKKQIQAFKKMEKEASEVKSCTFHPQINEPSTPSQFPVHERLYMVSSKKKITQFDDQRKNATSKQQSQNQEQSSSLFERMKSYVNQKKRHIHKIELEVNKELTFKPRINQRAVKSQYTTNITQTQSNISVLSDKKHKHQSFNSLSSYVLNTKKSQPESEKENNVSLYCETAYFEESKRKGLA